MERNLPTFFGVIVAASAVLAISVGGALAQSAGHRAAVEQSRGKVSSPPWGSGDEVGMANAIGNGTWGRCAWHLGQPGAKSYELSHVRSNTMPQSPFGVPLNYEYTPTKSIPFSKHAFNDELLKLGQPSAQGTQMDALGHFAHLPELWKKRWPTPSTATPVGKANSALVAGPPSPLKPGVPLPATVLISPLTASTRRTR